MMKFKLRCPRWISLFLVFIQFPNLSTALELDSRQLLSKMTLEQKVGQLFLIGFPQTELDQKLRSHIQKNKLAGFLLFKRNILDPHQLVKLNKALFEVSTKNTGVLPILAVDQEGGFVNRVPIRPSTPHAISVGISKSAPLSLALGNEIGKILNSLGFNMNLAPVLDLANHQKKSFIGVRAFGSDPTLVGNIGSAYSAGLLKNHVVPTAKHFPGLGDTVDDPHLSSIVRKDSAKSLLENDLVPFKMYSQLEGEKAIMLSHMIYPQLDDSLLPAPFSKKIIHQWLRQELGFEGVVLTDDLHMKASSDKNTLSEGAFKALEAGVDMVMLSWSFVEQEKTVQRIVSAYKNAELPLNELDEKVLRILRMKNFIAQSTFLPHENLEKILSSLEMDAIEQRLFKTKLELIKDQFSLQADKSVCAYSSKGTFLTDFRTQLNLRSRTFQMHPQLTQTTLEKSLAENSCQLNILTVYNRTQAQLAVRLSESSRKSLILLNMGSIAFLRDTTPFLARVETLSHYKGAGQDLARFLNEKINTFRPEDQYRPELARSRDVESRSSRRPSSQRPISSRPQ